MTAAAPETSPTLLYLTLGEEDENEVLELVRSDDSGLFVRENGQWTQVDPTADDPRLWDRVILEVTEDAVSVYDTAEDSGDPITADEFTDYVIEDTEAAS